MSAPLNTFTVTLKGPASGSVFVIRSNVPRLSQRQVLRALQRITKEAKWADPIDGFELTFDKDNGVLFPVDVEIDTKIRWRSDRALDDGWILIARRAVGCLDFN